MKKLVINILVLLLLSLLSLPNAVQAQHQRIENNGYLYQNGKMMQVREGNLIPVKENVVLHNGLTVLPSGVLVQQNGKKSNLRDGQAIDGAGRILSPETRRDGTIILVPSARSAARPQPPRMINKVNKVKIRGNQNNKAKGKK